MVATVLLLRDVVGERFHHKGWHKARASNGVWWSLDLFVFYGIVLSS